MRARIYRPSKTAMQSGRGKMDQWVLEYETQSTKRPEPLMGWTSSSDTLSQVRLEFPSLEQAEAFAIKKGFSYTVQRARERRIKPRNYGDNFRYRPEDQA